MGSAQSSCEAPLNPAFPTLEQESGANTTIKEVVVKEKTRPLPQPVKYDEVQREAYQALKWEPFEGAKFDVTKPLNPNFFLSHRLALGMRDVDIGDPTKVLRTPYDDYSFGATVATENMLLMGTINAGGVLTSRATVRANENVSLKYESRISPESYDQPQFMTDIDMVWKDGNCAVKYGMGGFWGANFMQSITPTLTGGAEVFYLSQQRKSGVGVVLRAAGVKSVGTLQLATTGMLSSTYHQRINEKANVAADFLWNWMSNEATASVGYDYQFRQCRLRGNVNSDGKILALLEEKLGPGVTLLLSSELDHARGDHKFGFGMVCGE